ncbi:GNAT family N-acetyltransferase [Aneurinibacillus aneurinilyticus]|jgi:GNAT superfamily N-acetyltransferase|uniref:GNAT family N-acetyltransferase n=2 Tax=Aneurinibacillus aneurinilyticus TaxID=1391 RepID=A0A848CVS9_ANEAE|nr:GNAT family N-acetyltransferase [Aneurinibacillus aneurinilyticus]ERI08586.1 acetyltransferase, GNAT family [Aneurinibacillus aneurinilyticus ATCC 12856]MCI1693545.1 GNAT family N-acetyltransferase [Aneurinibacillus aneurinilyticus]MED0706112.1 GNAT family N-acetyltransferase [Aneurinibacillus aneurinilyticus]MED0725086.1 GNAT family N-acetyltransferase [Aneurinibacillus aneurinilyticus]MED0732686.1 GNAT family N-acetyltransferase [Aneurinibacillus aneurinilyticus]
MPVYAFSPDTFSRAREKLIRFSKTHGDRRITAKAIRWVQEMPEVDINQEGTLLLAYVHSKKLLGFLAVAKYGIRESFLVVHPKARTQQIGKTLTEEAIHRLGKLYARVAADNMPSLKTCFAARMVAFSCIRGVTGKPTLWLAAGDWSKDDVERL